MKFKYHFLENKLSHLDPNHPEYSYQIPEESQFTANFGGSGFVLGDQSWITFAVYEKKIGVFAKFTENGVTTYYKRDFAKAEIISFELSAEDQVEKNEKGWWIPKRESG